MGSTGSSFKDVSSDEQACDLVVGLPTCNHASTAPAVAEVVESALTADGSLRWRIVIADGGSIDGTRERVRNAVGSDAALLDASYSPKAGDELSVPYHGLPGRARALGTILQHAAALQARACLVLDAAATNTTREWVTRLVQPLAAGEVDFIAARHARHPFTGALVHGVVYPMFRALYGVRLRDPVATDFGCSAALIEAVHADPIWEDEKAQLGIDLWMVGTAVSRGLRVGQTSLGPKLREDRGALDTGTAVAQVISSLFRELERGVEVWQRVRESQPMRDFGDACEDMPAPEVDARQLIESFRLGHRELQDVWSEVLPPLAILQWRRLASAPLEEFRVDDALWARTVYDFAMGYRVSVIARDHLLRSLAPLYLGWLASFVLEVRHLTLEQIEQRVERLCMAFETEKPYLISMWRWPERFKPVRIRR
jgi:hypothetical protein